MKYLTEKQKAEARERVRNEYASLTGEPCTNEQNEPDIDYVEYLESLVADRGEYVRDQIIKDRKRVKKEYYITDDLLSDIIENLPINLE